MRLTRVALIGDHDPSIIAHNAIPRALQAAAAEIGRPVEWRWLGTELLEENAARSLREFGAAWCVPGSPYRSESGALAAIAWARTSDVPFLGTCGGCQHALLEYARNVLDLAEADHAETNPDAALPLISPLSCAMVEATGSIHLTPGSKIHGIYGRDVIEEGYHCRYGLNPRMEHLLAGSPLRISGRDPSGEARAFELTDRTFFLLTQFQPERHALAGEVPAIVRAFLSAAAA
jgi:CTP synthase (UTP-ammonia lyase)